MDGQTDGLTDRQHHHANSQSRCVQYSHLKMAARTFHLDACSAKAAMGPARVALGAVVE